MKDKTKISEYKKQEIQNNFLKRQKCEVYTRVMGYHRPVSQFNEGKKSEYYSRTYFQENKTTNSKFCSMYSNIC